MEELLRIYYSINVNLNNKMIFSYGSNNYILLKLENIDFDLLNSLVYFDFLNKPILNIYNQYITEYQNAYYSLFYYDNYVIDNNYVISFLNQNLYIINNNMHDKWCKKIDYHEYQITQFGAKFLILRESINYVIGLSEIGIQLLNTINLEQCYSCYVHNRITNRLFDFKNPFNICIDYRIRDISEYVKYMYFFEEKEVFESITKNIYLNIEEYKLLFARLLLITPYYDLYEQIIDGKKEEKEIEIIVSKLDSYQEYIKKIYLYLKRYINIDNIELFSN